VGVSSGLVLTVVNFLSDLRWLDVKLQFAKKGIARQHRSVRSIPRGSVHHGVTAERRRAVSPGGELVIENSANQAVTTSRLGLTFRAHGDRPRELPARWRTIP
jgi:hypothetical protein